ncbi:EBP-domain-containing protein [Xylariaceae sp. FL0016]|nr:EBP-domain-containing protein [Xylariaceae sp. FL0016]
MSSWWPLLGARAPEAAHPYYPLDVTVPFYEANEAPVPMLLASLAGMLGCALLITALVACRVNPNMSWSSLAVFCWFITNGCLHCVFEGFFVLNHATVASSQNILAQLWKEYALSDSRYLTSDFFMLSVESITVFIWGPLCFANAVSIMNNSALRHPLRVIICMAHLYGVALYYSTSLCELYFTGRSHSRPEVLYFWVYYIGFNLPWAIVPSLLLIRSVQVITRAMRLLDKMGETLSINRQNKKLILGPREPKKTK